MIKRENEMTNTANNNGMPKKMENTLERLYKEGRLMMEPDHYDGNGYMTIAVLFRGKQYLADVTDEGRLQIIERYTYGE